MKISFILCFWVLCTHVYAQNVVVKEPCVWHKKGTPNREAAHAHYVEETNKLYLTYMGKTKLCLKTYVDMNKTEEYCFERTEDAGLFNQVADALLKDQKEYYLFFANASCAQFSVTVIDLLGKSIKTNPLAFEVAKDEFYLYSFVDQGDFYILTSVKRTSSVRLYKYNYTTQKFDPHLLSLDAVKFPNTTKEVKLWDIISDDKAVSYADIDLFKYSKNASPRSEVDPKVVSRALKFYDRKGRLIITIDGYNNMTYLIDVDLASYKFVYNTYSFPKIGAPSNEVQKNSYLFENTLIQVKASDEVLIASIVDLQSKEVLGKYSFSSTDEVIPFSNTPIYTSSKDKGLFSTEFEGEIKRIKKFLRICSSENVFVGAIRNQDDHVEMSIGSFYTSTQTVGVGAGTGAGSTTTAVEYIYYFKSLLSQDFAKNIPGKLFNSNYDLLLDAQKKLTCPSKAQTIFNIKGTYYLGHFFSTYPNTKPGEVEDFYYITQFGND